MPNATPINPALVRIAFTYDSATGALKLKTLGERVARRMSTTQWQLDKGTYSVHRLVWAWHNPDNANPRFIKFVDGDRTNTRIENLKATNVHPQWENHAKRVDAIIDDDGRISLKQHYVESKDGALIPKHLLAVMNDDDKRRHGVDTSSPSGDEHGEHDYFNYQ